MRVECILKAKIILKLNHLTANPMERPLKNLFKLEEVKIKRAVSNSMVEMIKAIMKK